MGKATNPTPHAHTQPPQWRDGISTAETPMKRVPASREAGPQPACSQPTKPASQSVSRTAGQPARQPKKKNMYHEGREWRCQLVRAPHRGLGKPWVGGEGSFPVEKQERHTQHCMYVEQNMETKRWGKGETYVSTAAYGEKDGRQLLLVGIADHSRRQGGGGRPPHAPSRIA